MALEQQIELLTLKKEHLENLIDLAKGLKLRGVRNLKINRRILVFLNMS